MQWVAYIELLGLYAVAHRAAAAAPVAAPVAAPRASDRVADVATATAAAALRPVIVLAGEIAADGCPLAFGQGLRLGMPRRQVLRQVPGAELAVFGSVDYEPEIRASRDACARRTPWVEPLTGHQLFLALPVPDRQPPLGELAALLAAVAPPGRRLARAALAPNKLLARAAAETLAPGARPALVWPGEEGEFLARLPPAALWPARPELLRRLGQLGLARIGELARIPAAEWLRQFGPEGYELARWARGIYPEPVRAAWPPRAVCSRLTFPVAVTAAGLPASLRRAAVELAQRLTEQEEVGQAVTLRLEIEGVVERNGRPGAGSPQPDDTVRRVLPRRTRTAAVIEQALLALLHGQLQGLAAHGRYTALTATVEALAPAAHRQLDIWGEEARRTAEREERLSVALAAVQSRFPERPARIGIPATALPRREAMLSLYDPMRGGGRFGGCLGLAIGVSGEVCMGDPHCQSADSLSSPGN